MEDIDIVIPWVDPNDSKWQAEKQKYSGIITNTEDARDVRYRDWNNLKYVFRSISKFAPWVRMIHFITWGHIPKWMDTEAKKLHVVRHEEYIPMKFLPTFSSHVIELHMNEIPRLSEKFIYFNDDIFLIKPTKPSDFFQNGLPCDCNGANLVVPSSENFMPIVFNSVAAINKNFEKHNQIKKMPFKWINPKYGFITNVRNCIFSPWPLYTGFKNYHLAVSYLKSTLDDVWSKEKKLLDETSAHRFRDNYDINQYIFRYWQLASGRFYPHSVTGKYFKISNNVSDIINYIQQGKRIQICINDDEFDGDFEQVKSEINKELQKILPDKCEFEK